MLPVSQGYLEKQHGGFACRVGFGGEAVGTGGTDRPSPQGNRAHWYRSGASGRCHQGLLAPEYDLRGIKRKQYRRYSRLFKKGECYRLSLDTLREAGGKATTAAIAAKIVTQMGFPLDQQGTVCDSVNNSLRYAERNGAIARAGLDGISIVWKLI